MPITIKKIIAVLNDFAMMDEIIAKTFAFADANHATVEILYVHESPLFDIPDFFHAGETESMDTKKIKVDILEKVQQYSKAYEPVVFIEVDDTPDRVLALAHQDPETLIITAYHHKITHKIIRKLTQPILILKQDAETYQKIGLILNGGSPSSACIAQAKAYFPKSDISLLYDYHFVVDTTVETDLQEIQMIEDAQREVFASIKAESGLKGTFFVDGAFLDTELHVYLEEKGYDLLYICGHPDHFFISDDLAIPLLDTITCDILLHAK